MYKIDPITITDTIFTGSNVPEADYQEFDSGTAYAVEDTVMVATSTANVHKNYECAVSQAAGLTADLLSENCTDISDWTDLDGASSTSEVSPVGQFKFYAAAGQSAYRRIALADAIPATFTIQMKTYFDNIGTYAGGEGFYLWLSNATWKIVLIFASDGLYVSKAGGADGEVGTNIVKSGSSAAVWQYWRFQVNKTTESTATVEVYLKEEGGAWASQGTVDCDYEIVGTNKRLDIAQYSVSGTKTSHIDYIKIATGLGLIEDTSTTPYGSSDWLELESTNRWKCFNAKLGSQTEQATKIEYVLTPGEVIDSVALLNLESDTVDIVLIDSADQLIVNNDWTDATGGTPPTGWTEVGTVSNFTIESAALKITADANGEGISQTITVSAATEYQLVFKYKNTAGDIAQVRIEDLSAEPDADILALTDLTSSTANASYSKVFTTPAGCTSIKISFLCKTAGDVIWIEAPFLCPTEYSETVTTGAITDVVKNDIPEIATCILTVTINDSGTAAIGELIIGNQLYLGEIEYGVQCGIEDYSTIDQDLYGNYDITERGYAKRMTCSLLIENTTFDAIHKALAADRAQFRVWVGSETYTSMIIYGKYDSFNMVMPGPEQSSCALDIIGLSSGE